MKVLFLDIDGVVNSRSTTNFKNNLWPVDPHMATMVVKIQRETGCEVVLSSSWRSSPDGIAKVCDSILPIYDKTPTLGGWRGDEVRKWLEGRDDVERYAILDDDSDFYPEQPLFKTTFQDGLTEEIAEAVTKHLNGVQA